MTALGRKFWQCRPRICRLQLMAEPVGPSRKVSIYKLTCSLQYFKGLTDIIELESQKSLDSGLKWSTIWLGFQSGKVMSLSLSVPSSGNRSLIPLICTPTGLIIIIKYGEMLLTVGIKASICRYARRWFLSSSSSLIGLSPVQTPKTNCQMPRNSSLYSPLSARLR